MGENVFDKDVSYLREVYDKQLRIEDLNTQLHRERNEEKKQKKALVQQEKSKNDEIAATVKKRKAEIQAVYDEEINTLQEQLKKIENERESCKTKQQNKRYEEETKQMRQNVEECRENIKSMLKQHHISRICRSEVYYRLFFPKGTDYITLLAWIAVSMLLIPTVLCKLSAMTFLKENTLQKLFFVMIFLLCISLVVSLYLWIANRTKVRYEEPLKYCRDQMQNIRKLHKSMRKIHKNIRKDKDESDYDLAPFDEKLQAIRQEMNTITEKKITAVKEFTDQKQAVIEQEISKNYEPQMQQISQNITKTQEKQESILQESQNLKLDISQNYETYLGKNNVKIEQLEILIEIMQEEKIATVGEAIAAYEGRKETKQ